MPRANEQPKQTIISLLPLRITWKTDFVNFLSEELTRQGYITREFSWRSFGLQRTHFVILHWPNEFFAKEGKLAIVTLLVKLAIMRFAKILWGTQFVWIAHNATPHDAATSCGF